MNSHYREMPVALTTADLIREAKLSYLTESNYQNSALYGVTEGKAVGTLIEQKFKKHLVLNCVFGQRNSANGIDLPDPHILPDIKLTSVRQPPSSSPFKRARQKIYGLGYNLLLFVHDKGDDPVKKTALLQFVRCSFVDKTRTVDYTTTFRLREVLVDSAIVDDVAGFLMDTHTIIDFDEATEIAKCVVVDRPEVGEWGVKKS